MLVEPIDDIIKLASLNLLRALRDENGVVWEKTIAFSMHSEEGDDQGDWEISVKPTRFPAGKKVTR